MQRELFERPRSEMASAEHVCAEEMVSYHDLLASAECVLRGESHLGAFGCIEDARQRRKLAVDLMQRDATEGVPHHWLARFHAFSSHPAECLWRLDFVEAVYLGDEAALVRCRCGLLSNQHAAEHAHMEEAFVPLCWHDYLHSEAVAEEIRRRRVQAVGNFPPAMFAAVWAAYSDGPETRVNSAWRVLDAVDGGHKIIAPLARFLRINRKAVRSSSRYRAIRPADWVSYSKTRRTLRALPAMPGHILAAGLLRPEELQAWLPTIDLIARAASIEPAALFHAPRDLFEDVASLPQKVSSLERRKLLRTAIRVVRRNPVRGVPVLLSGILFRPYLRPEPVSTPLPRLAIELSRGWCAHSLLDTEEIEREGRQMAHCVGTYARRAARGEVQIFGLQRSDGVERATVVIRPPPYTCESHDPVDVEVAASHNGPLRPSMLIALGELLQEIGGPDLEVHLGTI